MNPVTRHAEWLQLIEKAGPFLAVAVLEEAFPQGLDKIETPKRQRVRSAYDEWRDAVDEGDAQIAALHREWIRLVLEELLEYDPGVITAVSDLPATLAYHEPQTGAVFSPDFGVVAGDKVRLLISCYPPDTDLQCPLPEETWVASPVERMTQLCRATGVRIGLVTDGEQWTLVSVPTDGSSSVATWYARIWQQEPITLQAFQSLLGVRRCFGLENQILEALLERSLEHQNEITDTLGEQVRRAVEVLVQALDRADIDRNRQLLQHIGPSQLYEAGLTVMMRLVFVLCAEERKLLLLGEPIYDQCYAASTLRAQLRDEAERLGLEVLERRHDAWSRLLAVFRAIYGGIEHETLRLPPLGGSLFDPDVFPFLEGRSRDTNWKLTPAVPLPIDNRTVLLLLNALQVLEHRSGAQLLSYQALDVEQIGHVYEGLLERTVKRVPEITLGLVGSQKVYNPNVPLRELETAKAGGDEKLVSTLVELTGRGGPGLTNALIRKVEDAAFHRVLAVCGHNAILAERIRPFANLVRTDNWGDPLVYREQAFAVTLGTGRRSTGTHYTPKTLTEPIVQRALEPLVYIGPAEGISREQWKLKSPSELLELKVADMAMGSGAFLVQSCRYLAERLVEAWEISEKSGKMVAMDGSSLDAAENHEILPRDQAERLLIARRLVVGRCLYGVDINPMAVELAKLSLWLVTMQKNRPFTFLNHALKCGDSLLGVSDLNQIENFSLRPGVTQVTFATANLFRYVEEASAKRRELEELPSNDHIQNETKSRLHIEAEASTAKVKALADCLIAFELKGLNGDSYEEQRAVAADHAEMAMKKTVPEFQAYAREQLLGRRTFHWSVEFPEVFSRGGFDSFVGNPPFMGGRKMRGNLGGDYLAFIIDVLFPGSSANADLCAFFFRRAFFLLRPNGVYGLLATNTIAQGDTRETGLDKITGEGGVIIGAVSSAPWPGEAGVKVAQVWLRRGSWKSPFVLDGESVPGISAFLGSLQQIVGKPFALRSNAEKSFQGSIVLGMGFVLPPEEAERLCSKDSRNREVLYPYLTGEDLNSSADHSPSRWVINFHDWPLDALHDDPDNPKGPPYASDYSDCLRIVEQKVKPERQRKKDDGSFALRKPLPQRWWHYADKRPALYAAIRNMPRVLCKTRHSPNCAFEFVKSGVVFQESLIVFAVDAFDFFAVLSSTIHECWAWEYGSTLGDTTLRYSSSDCFDTFPLPAEVGHLADIGWGYFDFRQNLMHERQEGLTCVYNRFHDPSEKSEDIARLRTLHIEMNQAVARSYGWNDLDLGHGFHKTKQGERFTISESARRAVLNRLLKLNHERYEAEVKAGLHEKKGKKGAKQEVQSPHSADSPELF